VTIDRTSPGVLVGNSTEAGSGADLLVLDPSTGDLLTTVRAAGPRDVDTAATAAQAAADAWSAIAPSQRGRLLAACAQRILERRDGLAEVVVHDAGIPRSLAARDVETAARYFEYYAGAADKLLGQTVPLGADVLDYTMREPWGVCGIILPFNFPLQLAARDLGPALAVGNTVVAKPPEQAPLAVQALVECCWDAGIPAGVLNCVTGDGTVGEALVGHPLVDHVTFTGSQLTGRRVMASCAELLRPSTIELGGKSPHLLFEDARVDSAVASIIATSFKTAGQACSAGTRVLVHRDRHGELLQTLAEAVAALHVGRASDDPDVGPLISERQRSAVADAVAQAVSDGADAVCGGARPDGVELDGGFFFEPTVLDGLSPAAPAAREEIFGPVVSVLTFSNEADAVGLANDSELGLVAGVWTQDLGRAHRVAREIKAGQIFVNNYGVGGGVELPFGGYKRSGIGRVKGLAALDEYTQLKNVCVALT
jgi:acyl-CoA reductase-like NAD-dependent aldehyde dehydrogenase